MTTTPADAASPSRPTAPITVAQIGPWPKPWGGISVYVQRLSRRLASHGHRVLVLDPQGNTAREGDALEVRPLPPGRTQAALAARHMVQAGVDVAHLHLIGLPWKTVVPYAVACESVGVPLIISVHSLRDSRAEVPKAERAGIVACGRSLAATFASGTHVARGLVARGLPAHKVRAVAPFVAPTPADPPGSTLPPDLRAFCANHSPLISAGAAALTPTEQGKELYGFDIFAHIAAAVTAELPTAGLVFQLPRRGDEALYAEAMAIADAAGVGDRLLIHTQPLDDAPDLWAVSDLFVRPTRSDGDSVSIREALSLGVPTLASDVVERPEGCVLFASGDGAAAGEAALGVLRDLPAARAQAASAPQPHGADDVEAALLAAARHRSLRGRLVRGSVQLSARLAIRLRAARSSLP